MLVTFRTKSYADITMFGEIAIRLLKLAGMTGMVPTAILAADVPDVLAKLERGLAAQGAVGEVSVPSASARAPASNPRDDDADAQPVVPLRHRALPLIGLLRAAGAAGTDVIVSSRG
jgi:hypothetical protein